MKKIIANKEIEVNEEGYLLDFKQWDREVSVCIAGECDIVMTAKHWEVIEYIHDKHKNEESLSIRGIKKSGDFDIDMVDIENILLGDLEEKLVRADLFF